MARAAIVVVLAAACVGCTHQVRVLTEPPGAHVVVDGLPRGPSPVVFEEKTGSGEPVVLEVSAPGYRPVRVVAHRTSFSVPLLSAGLVGGAAACAGCAGGAAVASIFAPPLLSLGLLGIPLFAMPVAAAALLGRQLPDTLPIALEPLQGEEPRAEPAPRTP